MIRANAKDGTFKEIGLSGDTKWWFHPTKEKETDVAVAPWPLTPLTDNCNDCDAHFLRTDELFLTDELRKETSIGVGDEVYTVGLFTKLRGEEKNSPIVRTGTIAMTPEEMLPTAKISEDWSGPIEAFLIESRSVGGLSGSPVFARENIVVHDRMITRKSGSKSTEDVSMFGPLFLFGLAQGHWEIEPDDKNKVEIESKKKSENTVNLGIAIVIPAKTILEVLCHPELVELRDKAERQEIEAGGPTTQD